MGKDSTKDKILAHAAQLIHRKGFNNTGIQEILQSAGVPKGSFYFYFKSKEDLGLALIDYYAETLGSRWRTVLEAPEVRHLKRLERFFDETRIRHEQDEGKSGCPIGNLTQEMGVLSDAFQAKLRGVFSGMKASIKNCLAQAQADGEISPSLDADATADFILNSWEGALLRMKAEGHTGPLVLFQRMVFDRVLRA
ncbi:MAG: TetR family transcriptional regulator C-terminal domain-containing protein [Desulfomonile tiedjei]|nr:TetR family transcriptional regulator C-terminal domain-containing protein [Desulfomonile tiedjei]